MTSTFSLFPHLTDLLSERLGGRAVACSDDFFASMHNLVRAEEPRFDPDAYGERGKIMDGWESRRRRGPGHDWCILALGAPGRIEAIDIDTRHFTGNHAPWASLEATRVDGEPSLDALRAARWVELLPSSALRGGQRNPFPIAPAGPFTHVRLRIYPDGGVARLRVYGTVVRPLAGEVDLAALENGGKALACSDMYFGVMDHLIAPGRARDMRDGWETRRRRGPGEDWVLIRLAARGTLRRLVLDTAHFKGNYPDVALVEGIDWTDGPPHALLESRLWSPVLPWTHLRAHHEHAFDLDERGPFTHLRLRIAPCGGVSRLRAFGTPTPDDPLATRYDALSHDQAEAALSRACGSTAWVRRMMEARPFGHRGRLYSDALRIWWDLGPDDWREAFAHHPRIGEDPERLRRRFAATSDLSAREQAGVAGASEAVLQELQRLNEAYEARFGHVFLICATGLSAAEMLDALRRRIHNEPERELREAAAQQAAITQLRLRAGVSS